MVIKPHLIIRSATGVQRSKQVAGGAERILFNQARKKGETKTSKRVFLVEQRIQMGGSISIQRGMVHTPLDGVQAERPCASGLRRLWIQLEYIQFRTTQHFYTSTKRREN